MKTCPFCAEQIQEDAIKCRFCGEFLQKKDNPALAATAAAAPIVAEESGGDSAAAKAEARSEAERVTKELLHNWKFARWFP